MLWSRVMNGLEKSVDASEPLTHLLDTIRQAVAAQDWTSDGVTRGHPSLDRNGSLTALANGAGAVLEEIPLWGWAFQLGRSMR